MEPAAIGALSGLLGSLFGGSASIATTWLAQHGADRRKRFSAALNRRESLYADFINECSKLVIDSLDHTLDRPETMITAYALFNRIRLVSSPAVVTAADTVMRSLVEGYFRKNLTLDEIKDMVLRRDDSMGHPLSEFSLACRQELDGLHRYA